MTTLYGIHNCDTVKKAQKWLTQNNIEYTFHDFRKDGLTADLVNKFLTKADWSSLINKRSTTYRNLDDQVKNNLEGETALNIVLEQPTLLKRPVLVVEDNVHLGFKEQQYQKVFTHE